MKKYENLVNELSNVKASIEYIKVLKWFDAEVYKNNKVHVDNELERLDIERERLLTALEELINDKESV